VKVVYTSLSCFHESTETIGIDVSKRLLSKIFDHGHELAHYVIHKLGLRFDFHLLYDTVCPQGLLGRARTRDLL